MHGRRLLRAASRSLPTQRRPRPTPRLPLSELLLDGCKLESRARWTQDHAQGTVRRTTAVIRSGVDEVAAVGAAVRAETRVAEGRQALAPTDGSPRVMAGRALDAGAGRQPIDID